MGPTWNGKSRIVTLEGVLIPWLGLQPQLVQVDDCDDFFLPLFSTEEKLREFMVLLDDRMKRIATHYTIKEVTDGFEFLDSIFEHEGVRIMLDPILLDNNRTRWTEVIKRGDEFKFFDAFNAERN
jgi:hypothetical protein